MNRIDDLARGLALRSARSGTEVDEVATNAADLKLERIARAAAAPITRRRALRVAGGALIATAVPTTLALADGRGETEPLALQAR